MTANACSAPRASALVSNRCRLLGLCAMLFGIVISRMAAPPLCVYPELDRLVDDGSMSTASRSQWAVSDSILQCWLSFPSMRVSTRS